MANLKYYAVKAICGHVGRKNYIVITFPVHCESKKEAAKIVRFFPRVKHDRKDAILKVEAIDEATYDLLVELNRQDSYLKCTSKQEQRLYCPNLGNRLYQHDSDDVDYKELRNTRKEYLVKKEKSKKKFEHILFLETIEYLNGGNNYALSY